jgi:hypothetical protein
MPEARANTLCIGAKTYNISQLNSVSVQCIELSDSSSIWTAYILAGVCSWIALPHILSGWSYGLALLFGTIVATDYAIKAAKASKYKLFRLAFDMSSGSVNAFETRDETEAFRMRDDIIKGLETGILPDYLRNSP